MTITRKLTTVGESRGVTLPKSWIDYAEKEAGQRIVKVAMLLHNKKITITPLFEDKKLRD